MTTVSSPTRLWRYTAIDIRSPAQRRSGELAGATAADIRGALRRIGLQVIELRPVRSRWMSGDANLLSPLIRPFFDLINRHQRNRRSGQRAELYDSLATMLSAGLPLLEALQTLIDSQHDARRTWSKSFFRGGGGRTGLLIDIREQLRSGQSLGHAMQHHPSWFDAMDVAIVEAGQHAGNLAQVLASMAQRQQKSNELGHKLMGALAYPALVLMVGLGVAVFLSVKTLPELTKILTDAKVPVPALTRSVMWIGQLLAHHWIVIGLVLIAMFIAIILAPTLFRRLHILLPKTKPLQSLQRRIRGPRVLRTLAVGGVAMRLAELLRSGVPMVEALRVLAPTAANAQLRTTLTEAADRIERGEELSQALNDDRWFDAEFRRLLDIGQTTGELDGMLQRIGERYQRKAQRLIDRLTTLLEPLVILALAVLVGLVVMAAILPLLRLQEIL